MKMVYCYISVALPAIKAWISLVFSSVQLASSLLQFPILPNVVECFAEVPYCFNLYTKYNKPSEEALLEMFICLYFLYITWVAVVEVYEKYIV